MTLFLIGLVQSLPLRPLTVASNISRSMSARLTIFSLDAGKLVATPAVPAAVTEPSSSAAAEQHALSPTISATASRTRSEPGDAAPRAIGRRVSPRKRQVIKYEEGSNDDAAEPAAPAPPVRQSPAGKRPFEAIAIASSSKLVDGSPGPARKSGADAASSIKRARRSPVKGEAAAEAFTLDPPPRWRETYDEIVAMRAHLHAPVDGMGCAAAGEREQDPIRSRFAVLVSLMLSSQTKGASRVASCVLRAASG